MFRASACTNCRKRKTRCDGGRPRCRACCTSSGRFYDCEYTDSGITTSQRLEEQIAALEAKVHELEAQPLFQSSGPSQNPDSSSSACKGRDVSSSGSEVPLSGELHQTLMHIFTQHTAHLAFFLNTERFIGSSIARTLSAPHPLLHTIYLWGIHLSPEPVRQYESRFLSKALQSISHGLTRDAGLSILHMIQASVLIAQYFFRNSRILEGKYHMTTAHSLAIGAGLHTIRSVGPSPTNSAVCLPPPVDAIEEGERINAFWTTMILDNCWTSIDKSPSNMIYTDVPGSRIDTPWPDDMDAYVTHGIPNNLVGSQTVKRFLRGGNTGNDHCRSWMALYAKASILFERATRVGATHWKNISTCSPNTPKSSADFIAIEMAIETLSRDLNAKQSSPSITGPGAAVVPLLINAASIRLHEKFMDLHAQSHHRVINSARNIICVITHYSTQDRSCMMIDPILAPLSMIAFHILVKSPLAEFKTELQTLLNVMHSLSSCCPMMSSLMDIYCSDISATQARCL